MTAYAVALLALSLAVALRCCTSETCMLEQRGENCTIIPGLDQLHGAPWAYWEEDPPLACSGAG
eukprot:13896808-Alexandrium_andersonii.AAC.1